MPSSLFFERWRQPWLSPGIICAGFGLGLVLLLPHGVPVFNDDFGYLGSVQETVHRLRPWTDDWLEPWAAGLSVLSALLLWIFGSMAVATQGLQGVCAASGAYAAYQLLRTQGLSPRVSLTVAGLWLTMPTLLWKQVEFTAMVLYMPCLWWALRCALEERWGAFFVAWLLAFSSRQSALVWLALPAMAWVGGGGGLG